MLKQLKKVVKEWLRGTEVTDILPQQTKVVTFEEVQNMFQEGTLTFKKDAYGLRVLYKNQVVVNDSNEIMAHIRHFIDETWKEYRLEYRMIYPEVSRLYNLAITNQNSDFKASFLQAKSELNALEKRMYQDWDTFVIDSFLSRGGYELLIEAI